MERVRVGGGTRERTGARGNGLAQVNGGARGLREPREQKRAPYPLVERKNKNATCPNRQVASRRRKMKRLQLHAQARAFRTVDAFHIHEANRRPHNAALLREVKHLPKRIITYWF